MQKQMPTEPDGKARFNACFAEINRFEGRYRIFMGGAGSGKSVNIAQDFLLKLIHPEYRGANLLVVRKAEKSHRNSTFSQFCASAQNIFGHRWQEIIEAKQSPMKIICKPTGNEILFSGIFDVQNREHLKSIQTQQGKLCWIWCEEASELLQEDWEILDDRLRGELPDGLYYQMTCSFNPISSNHWLKKRFFDAENHQAMISCTTYRDNAFIDKGFKERMDWRKIHDPDGYRIYGLGEWGETQGAILTRYDIRDFERTENHFDTIAYGTDFGFHHPHVTVKVGFRNNRIFICDELVFYEKDSHEILDAMEGWSEKYWPMWCDSAEPDRIKMLRRAGWRARGVKKGPGSVLAQIDWLKAHQIWIHPACTKTIEEIQQWQWKRDILTGEWLDEPMNRLDDAMAALRYAIEGWRKEETISFD